MNSITSLNSSRLVSRIALLTGIVVLLLILTAGGFGTGDDSPQALQAQPESLTSFGYRIFTFMDGLSWVFIGLTIWALGVFIQSISPSRGRLASVCGIGTFVGVLGGFTRNQAISGLAASYISAPPAQQTAILYTYSTLYNLIGAMFTTAEIFQAGGFLIVASALLVMPGFPRWLAAWVGITGVTASILFVILIVAPTSSIFFPILLIHVIIGFVGLQLALAWRLWRPPAGNVSTSS